MGDHVLLNLQRYVQKKSLFANRPYPKPAYKFFGPFAVEKKTLFVTYKLTLPEDSRIHNVFHVSQLKPFTPNYSSVFFKLPRALNLKAATLVSVEILK